MTLGSCPVRISSKCEPGSQDPRQNLGSTIRRRLTSMVPKAGKVQRVKVRGTLAARSGSKSSTWV